MEVWSFNTGDKRSPPFLVYWFITCVTNYSTRRRSCQAFGQKNQGATLHLQTFCGTGTIKLCFCVVEGEISHELAASLRTAVLWRCGSWGKLGPCTNGL